MQSQSGLPELTTADRANGAPPPERILKPEDFAPRHSNGLDQFFSYIKGESGLSILDLAGVNQANVSFITNLGNEDAGHTVLTAIIQLAHGLGLTVIAEGVETAVQRRQLAELGANFCQGFYFARPMRAAHVEELIRGGGP